MFFYGYNLSYFLFMIPGLIISIWASAKVNGTFKKYNRVYTLNGLTGAQAARQILDANGLHGIRIERVAGNLSDHYDPRAGVVRLSEATFSTPSVGAVGVAAHEAGHAVQHAQGYFPARLRQAIVPICNVGTGLSVPLILIGFFLNVLGLVTVGIVLFSLAVVFQLVTLPVEFNASARAVATLGAGMITPEENAGVRKVLTAAALTYVAALLTSLLQLLYYITVFGGRRRN